VTLRMLDISISVKSAVTGGAGARFTAGGCGGGGADSVGTAGDSFCGTSTCCVTGSRFLDLT